MTGFTPEHLWVDYRRVFDKARELHAFSGWISNNVGGVKHISSTLPYALMKERHFALVEGLRVPTWGSL